MELKEKLKNKQARLGVVGMGYVGLPLMMEYAKVGFSVTGIDLDPQKVAMVNRGESYVLDIPTHELKEQVDAGLIEATENYEIVRELDTINICVPTPLRKTRDPDVSFIVDAVTEIKKYLRPGQLVILESTTYPGTTEELILPILEETGLKVGKDFFLAFSPERVDPGNEIYTTKNVPKVVGGITPECGEIAKTLYEQSIETIVTVSTTQVAEMVKLLENTFRSVNIALVNEIALMCNTMKINVWEVIDAAGTKPFGFMPFYPGPGLGGHCIPIDPFYLSWKARMAGFEARFIELAGQVNSFMPHHVVHQINNGLNNLSKCIRGSNILVLGIAYKQDIDDLRESPALDIIDLLLERGAKISYSDPYINEFTLLDNTYQSVELTQDVLKNCDCAVIVTAHKNIDYDLIVEHSPLIVDTRNALKGNKNGKIISL